LWKNTVYPIIKETGETVTEKWEIIYFQTPYLPKERTGGLLEWLTFFTLEKKGELSILKEIGEDKSVHKAVEVVEMMNDYDRLKEIARAREEARLNEWWALGASRQVGREEGIAEGMTKGLAEGMTKGLAEGTTKTLLSVARNLLAKNLPISLISETTGLSPTDIQKLSTQPQ
jgi:predicted transposase/invertase (TIGR01784 family)